MEYSELLLEIMKEVQTLTGVFFSEDDMTDCQIKLNGLTSFAEETTVGQISVLEEYEQMLDSYFEEIAETFGHHINSNFLKREIHRRYPMSVQLILECFHNHFPIIVPEPEVSNLAFFLAAELDQVRIVQNYCYIREPQYYAEKIVLTTDESVTLNLPEAILIKPFLIEKNWKDITEVLKIKIGNMKKRAFYKGMEVYGKDNPYILERRFKNIEEFFQYTGEERPESHYEFVLDINGILFPRLHYDDTPNSIRIYLLKYPFIYRKTSLHMIVFSHYQVRSKEMKNFYGCIRTLLEPGYINRLEKENLI